LGNDKQKNLDLDRTIGYFSSNLCKVAANSKQVWFEIFSKFWLVRVTQGQYLNGKYVNMIFTILGYVAYVALLFFAITWTVGVRTKLDAANWTIFGSLLFLLSSILVPLLQINFLHCLWIIPAIFLVTRVVQYLYVYNIPILKHLVTLFSTLYADIIRIGIDKVEIQKERDKSNKHFVDNWMNKNE
jgi:hypothetical protein